ncbi:MAG TPA: BON domain-containing protein [Candidatus Angelobacter sp.]|jgi:osmotically-inducible protein OsmY|nr:BON domain-containing protein [Candidatus Angelobacter sp.]
MLRNTGRLLLLLSVVTLCVAHSRAQDPQSNQQTQASSQPAPATQTQSEANSRIQRSIHDVMEGDQVLKDADITTTVDDMNITLSGSVDTYAQHQRALDIVSQYGRYRKIVDKIKVGQ